MAKIIDISYFFGELAIPQISDASVQQNLQWYIDVYEKKYLVNLLSSTFADSFLLGLQNDTQVYLDIRDGKLYVDANFSSVKWEGLRVTIVPPVTGDNPAPGRYTSPIANYIYWHYAVDNLVSSQTAQGEQKVVSKNARPIDPWPRLIKIWNEMVDTNRQLIPFLRSDLSAYAVFDTYFSLNPQNKEMLKLLSKRNPLL